MLRVSFPKLRAVELTLRSDLETLLGPVNGASFRERPRSIEVVLPVHASTNASVASRVAHTAFHGLGYPEDARFTLWAEGAKLDPYYDFKQTERIVEEAPHGMVKRFFERRANRLRDVLAHRDSTRRDLPPNQQLDRR